MSAQKFAGQDRISPERQRAIEEEAALMTRCAHWNTCNAVECPLDPRQGERGPLEHEQCHARIATRRRIIEEARAEGITTPLKYDGLLHSEWITEKRRARGKARWRALPEAKKQARLQWLAQMRLKTASPQGQETLGPAPI